MGKITFNLSQTSLSPGWDPAGDEHDALWQNFAAGYTYVVVGGATTYDSLRGSDPATGGTSDTFSSDAGSLDLTAHNFAGATSLDWSDNGNTATLALDAARNTIKNVFVSDFTGHKLVLQNWIDAWVTLDNRFGQEVRVDGAKRAEITTGAGNDKVWVGVDSNGPDWTNHVDVSTGSGNDDITVTVSTRDYNAAPYDPQWTTSTINAGNGDDAIVGGGGNDTVDGGTAVDVFVLHGAAAFYQVTTVGDVTTVRDLRTGTANQEGTDTLTRVERLQFADQAVQLIAPHAPHSIDLAHLDPADGFTILAPDATNTADVGASVAAAGDVNGDGFADVILGAPNAGSGSGAAYIIYGHASGDVDLSSPGANATVLTAPGHTGFGSGVASVGDFNGDGIGDLLIADADPTGPAGPSAFVVLGQAGGFAASVDIVSDVHVHSISFASDPGTDFRFPLSPPGDVNGDGLDDVLLSPIAGGNLFPGYLVYGEAGLDGSTTLNQPTFPDYIKGAGDINGDGLADLVFFNRKGVEGLPKNQIEVIYGNADPSQLNIHNAAYSFSVIGNVLDLEGAGDFNGDGLDDIVAAFLPTNRPPGGQDPGDFVATIVLSGNPSDPLAHAVQVRAESNSTLTSYHAVSIGDVNHDGYGDIALTHANSADVYVVFGVPHPATVISLDDIAAGDGGFKIIRDVSQGQPEIASAGDVNGDGVDDIVIGNPGQHAAYIVFGHGDWATDIEPARKPVGTAGDDQLFGSDDGDQLTGGGGDDHIYGNGGNDQISGGGGNDTLHGGAGDDMLRDALGNDVLQGGAGNDDMDGGAGSNTADYSDAPAGVTVDLTVHSAQDTGGDGIDTLNHIQNVTGSGFDDNLTGTSLNNVLDGGAGNDWLFGGGGDDRLIGGAGSDVLGGGAGADVFVYQALSDSMPGVLRDVIQGFTEGTDKIDLSAIDANTAGGTANDAFTFIGTAAFSHTPGQLRFTPGANNTLISGDANGDGAADFQILLSGNHTLSAADFLL